MYHTDGSMLIVDHHSPTYYCTNILIAVFMSLNEVEYSGKFPLCILYSRTSYMSVTKLLFRNRNPTSSRTVCNITTFCIILSSRISSCRKNLDYISNL